MRLNKTPNSVQRGGVQTESTFSIQTSAHAFEILSSGLYTDSVSAIVRELSSNAYDSHVQAGKADVPFDIHVPSRLEPWFAIRDYGTGLSHDDVLSVYTTYFQSTKSDSDDFIGALGLGSKSPFSYSSDFQVTSYFNGVQYRYAIFLNESGVPSVALMGETITDEPNGLEVRLPAEERRRFKEAISKYLAYFKVKPNVLGLSKDDVNDLYDDVRLPSDSELNEDGKWFIAGSDSGYYSSRVGIVYGQVPYPANVDTIRYGVEKYCTEQEISFYKTFSNRIVLIFDIGDLSITANREELKYDDATLQAIGGRISEFYKKFFSSVKTAIESYEHNDSLYKTNRYLSTDVFNGEKAFFKSIDLSQIDCDAYKKMKDYKSGWGNRYQHSVGDAITKTGGSFYSSVYLEYYYSQAAGEDKIRAKTGRSVDCLGIDSEIVYYVIDDNHHGMAKAKQAFERDYKNNKECAYVVIKPNAQAMKKLDDKKVVEELAQIKENLGNPDFVFTSTLTYTKPVRAKSTVSKKQVGTVFHGAPHWFDKTDLEFDKGGIYIYLAGGSKMYKASKAIPQNDVFGHFGKTSHTIAGMISIYNEVHGTEYTNNDLIGVSAADIKLFDDDSGWNNIIDTVESYILKNQETMRLKWQELKTMQYSYGELRSDHYDGEFLNISEKIAALMNNDVTKKSIDSVLGVDSDYYKLLETIGHTKKKIEDLAKETRSYESLLWVFADKEYKTASQQDSRFGVTFGPDVAAAIKKYPMVAALNMYYIDWDGKEGLQMVLNYANMIDKS